MPREPKSQNIGPSPFKKEDFIEALCCGPLCELLERVLETATIDTTNGIFQRLKSVLRLSPYFRNSR